MVEYEDHSDVQEMLGEPIYEKILDEVESGLISKDKASDIAYKLHPHVGGQFRISEKEFSRRAFRVMLSNWYDKIAYEYTRDTAVNKLLEVLRDRDISLPKVAKSIERLHCQSPDNTKRTQLDVDTGAGNIIIQNIQQTNFHFILAPELAKRLEKGQKDFLQEQCVTSGMPGTETSIITFQTIMKSICMISGKADGTGFLAKIPNCNEVAFLTAGHMFKDETTGKLLHSINFKEFRLHFGNIEGDANAGNSFSLGDFGGFRGSIGYDGERRFFSGGNIWTETSDPEEDYCVLLLNTKSVAAKGLKYLDCGDGDFLKCKPDELISIFGHPAVEPDWTNKNLRPLRASWGREKAGMHKNFIYYDTDTMPGSSGSPTIARGSKTDQQNYVVKGIHVKTIVKGATNGAQSLQNMKNWIPEPTKTTRPKRKLGHDATPSKRPKRIK